MMTHQEIKTLLTRTLYARCIDVYPAPTGRIGPFLMRGEPDLSKWSKPSQFEPKSGKDGAYGVFLGDNLSSLMFPNPGIYWIFQTNRLTSTWIDSRSEEFSKLIVEASRRSNRSPNKYGDYCECEREIHASFPVYDRLTGIATLPHAIPTSLAFAAILLMADRVEMKEKLP